MYTVLIVDDEPLVQVGLQSMLDWTALGVRLLPCASNGQTAWETIEREAPDLVFTDIRMPVVDGLELIRRCRAAPTSPEFIVLTSFEDFAYAREAMKHDVVDYLVKLEINPEVVTKAFEKARIRIEAHGGVTPVSDPDAFRDRAFFHLLNRGVADGEVLKNLEELGLTFSGRYHLTVACRLPQGEESRYGYIVKLVREILSREFGVHDLRISPTQFVLLLSSPEGRKDAQAVETRAAASVAAALSMATRYFSGSVEAGLGQAVTEVPALAESYRESLRALESCSPERPVVTHRSLGPDNRPSLSGEAFRHDLESALSTQNTVAMHSCFQRAHSSIEDHGRLVDALDLGTAAVYALLSTLPDAEEFLKTLYSRHPEGYKVLYAVPGVDHVLGWLTELEAGLEVHLETRGAGHQEKLVEAMKLYIDQHSRERLQLKTLAEHFRLSPNYAGTLFRKHTGRGFSEYVAESKISKARELLDSGKFRVYEVSDQLGFENSYYFSRVFRRVTGESPRQFRSRPTPPQE